ncbi:MAG: hypothetical protein KBB64_10425 [Bacteroidia bacterium]|nr:hypothetical protein [Bacteroidia bacterium]
MKTPDFNNITANIKTRKTHYTWLIDEHILHHANDQYSLASKFDTSLLPFKHLLNLLGVENINRMRAEYIAHRIFRKDGYIHSILKHSAIKKLPPKMIEHLTAMSSRPWKYIFAEIKQDFGCDFFQIEDAFTGESYWLYSPGMTATKSEHNPKLWFFLIGDNGECWETYGLIQFFVSFDADDVFFYLTELNSSISNEEELLAAVDNNPTEVFVLAAYSTTPITIHQSFELRYCSSEDYTEESTILNAINQIPKSLEQKEKNNIIQLTDHSYAGFPHFAKIYLDTKLKKIFRIACTETGFQALNRISKELGLDLDIDPMLNVGFSMYVIAETILKRKIIVDPYEHLFDKEKDAHKENKLQKENDFIQEILPYINNGQTPDISTIAASLGINIESANSIYKTLLKYKPN